jgi:hypothetical protein
MKSKNVLLMILALNLGSRFAYAKGDIANVDSSGATESYETSSLKAPPMGLTQACIAALELNHLEVTDARVKECAGPNAVYASTVPNQISRLPDSKKKLMVADACKALLVTQKDGKVIPIPFGPNGILEGKELDQFFRICNRGGATSIQSGPMPRLF